MVPRRGAFMGSWACASFALLVVTVLSSPSWASAAEGGAGEAAAAYAPPAAVAAEPPLGEFPACPAAPESGYEGEDDAARELRALRGSESETCLSVTALLRVLAERSWWEPAQTLALERSVAGDQGPAVKQLERIAANTQAVEGGPAEAVTLANPGAISGPVAESVDASGEAARHGLWFLGGAVVALVAAFAVWRTGSIRA